MNIALRIARCELRLEKLRNIANFADLTPGKFPQDMIKKYVTAIEWARSVGSAIVRFDSARQMVILNCPEADIAFWTAQSANLIAGLVAEELKNSDHMKAAGVLAFRADPDDGLIRLVDVSTATAHSDIYRRVTDRWVGGKRCRLCAIAEPPDSMELQAVDPEQRNGYNLVNGVQQLQPGVVHTHRPCREHWLRWLQIAQSYPSLEAAQAADLKAGRVSRGAPSMPQTDTETPTAAPAGWEPTRADQITSPPK